MKTTLNLLRIFVLLFALCLAKPVGAATVTWTGLGADQTWTNTANWSGGTPSGNIVVFPATMFPASTNVLGAINNIINTNITIAQLWYINTNAFVVGGSTATNFYDTTLINPYVTLTVTNNFYVGANNSFSATTVATMVGTNCAVIVSNLTATFGVGYTNNAANVQLGNLTLPDGTNFIDVGTFAVGNSDGGNGRQSILNLGNGTNVIEANVIELGWSKAMGRVEFGGPNGGVLISGTNGARASMILGRASSGSGAANGQLMLTNYANVLVGAVTNGWGNGDSSAGSGTGTIWIQNGVFDATSLIMGANTSGTQPATGTFSVGGDAINTATLIVNSPSGPGGGQVLLGDANNSTQTGTGTLNVNANGTAKIYCNINVLQAANNTGTVNLNGGTLILENNTNVIGSSALPFNTVNLSGGTLQFAVDAYNIVGANITATSLSAGTTYGQNIINISYATNFLIPTVVHLINYETSSDPGLSSFQIGTVPAGFTAVLEDNVNGDTSIDVMLANTNITVLPLLWVGAVGNTLNNNWNFTTLNWLNLTNGSPINYTNPYIVSFDDTSSNSTVNLTTNFLVGGLNFSNSILNYVLSGSGGINGDATLVMDGTAQVTLMESGGDNFAGGVAVNSGTVILDDANSAIAGSVVIAPGATLQIGNNDTHGNLPAANTSDNGSLIFDQTAGLTVSSPVTGSGTLTQNGTGKLALASAGNNYTGNTTVTAGTLALTGSGTISNSAAVAVFGGTLDVSGVPGVSLLNAVTLSNAVVVLTTTNSPFLTPPINFQSSTLTMIGTTNKINVTALPAVAFYPSTLTLIQGGSLSGFNMGLGTLPAGYTGYVTNNYDNGSGPNNAVLLVLTSGPTNARPYVIWSGVDAQNSVNTNWSDAQNWNLAGPPLTTDTVVFDDADQQTASANSSVGGGSAALNFPNINNIVDANFTVANLIYTNFSPSSSATYQNTYINDGVTLTVTNSLAFGGFCNSFGSTANNNISISGTNGTLVVSNTSSILVIGLGDTANAANQGTVDLSGLGTFNASVSLFNVGAVNTASTNASGVAYLAQTNTIFATGGSGAANETGGQSEALSLMIGETGKNVDTESFLYLGQQNVIHAWTIGVGIAKSPGEIEFNPIFSNPTVTIVGGDGVSPVQVWSLGDGLEQTGGSSKPTGTADFTGGTVNASVTTMYVGRTPNASGPNTATGTLTFGAGTIAVGTMYNGFQAFSVSDNGSGTVNVNGPGTLEVSTLNLAFTAGSTGAASTTGTLNIAGGMVEAGTIAADTNNLGQSSVTLSGATLIVSNAMGSSAAPLTSLTLQGTLQLTPNASSTNIVATSISISGPTVINIASVTTSVGGSQQIPIISYLNGSDPTLANVTLGTIPFGYSSASLVDDGISRIYLQITAPASLLWVGALSNSSLDGNWNTADQNWLSGASYANYNDPDFVQFTDTSSNSTVTVAVSVAPDSFTVSNNVLNYVFNGSHGIGGTAQLVKSGTASLTLADTGGDSFSAGIIVNGGSVFLNDAGSSIGGNLAIASGASVQLGNNNANGNLPGNVTDNGSLILDRSNSLIVPNNLSGSGTLLQIDTNTVTLSGANTGFTGKLFITNGILNTTTTAALGALSATVIVTNGGSLDDNGVAYNNVAAPSLIVSGAGYNGAGAIINSGAQQIGAFSNITVAANVTLGGINRWDLRAGSGSVASLNTSPPGTPYSITKVGANEVSLVSVGTIDAGLGNIFVQQGELAIQLSTVQLGNPASNLVVSAGALLEMFGASTPLNKVITFNGNGTSDSFKSDTDTASQNVIIGPVTLNSNCIFDISSGQFATIDSVISGSGGLTKITSGILTLTNVNTYTGNTTISGGTLALTGSGSLASTNIVVASGAILNASGRTNQTLTLKPSQTLSGFGSVTGLVVVASGSTLAPGSAAAIGTLTVGNNVTLAGTNTMKVSRVSSATNDVLSITGTLLEGGTLNVTSLGGTYVAGDTFKLFTTSGAISGSFSATNLPALGGGLGWVTTNLANGILTVVNAVNTNPTNITAVLSGNLLALTWPGDHLGWRLQVQTNSLATGLNTNANDWFTVPGSTSVTNENITVDPSQGTVFYRLVYP